MITDILEGELQNLEDRLIRIEERAIRKIASFVVIGIGAIFLVFALFFSLKEFLVWSNGAAYFSIGVLMLVTGLLLNVGKSKKKEHAATADVRRRVHESLDMILDQAAGIRENGKETMDIVKERAMMARDNPNPGKGEIPHKQGKKVGRITIS